MATLDGNTIWLVCASEPGAGNQGKTAFISHDGGRDWQLRAGGWDNPIGNLPTGGYLDELKLATPTEAFLGLDRGGLLRSTDAGRTWVGTSIRDEAGIGVHNLWFVDALHGWVADADGLWRTLDSGSTWTLVSSSPESS